MTIVATDAIFPNNAVDLIAVRSQLIDSSLSVHKRPLRATDPNQAIGVYGALWTPVANSEEMRGNRFAGTPSLSRYIVVVQAFVKDTEEVRGLNTHAVLARLLRSMLYTDDPLRVALASLSSSLGGMTERSQRWGIQQQRFFANEIRGEWLYLSILEFWLETEMN